jgi:hypothetical protein
MVTLVQQVQTALMELKVQQESQEPMVQMALMALRVQQVHKESKVQPGLKE